MTQQDEGISARLNDLNANYRQQLPERITYIKLQFEAYCSPPHSPAALHNLHKILHKLAGSGAAFGHEKMGKIARHWEHLAYPLLNSTAPPSILQLQEMEELMSQLSRAAAYPDES